MKNRRHRHGDGRKGQARRECFGAFPMAARGVRRLRHDVAALKISDRFKNSIRFVRIQWFHICPQCHARIHFRDHYNTLIDCRATELRTRLRRDVIYLSSYALLRDRYRADLLQWY